MNVINENLEKMSKVAANPRAQLDALVAKGKKAIGCFPVYSPAELVIAAGMEPFAVWGAEIEISSAKKYFPSFYCGIAQTSLEMGLSGALNKLSGAMIPTLCDTLKCLGQNWKVGVPQVPFIPVVHPQNRKLPAGVVYMRKQYVKIADALSAISGTKVTAQSLQKAIELCNANRAALREFSEVAAQYPDLISPAQRSAVIKSGGFMPRAEHTALVRQIIEHCRKQPVKTWPGYKVVTTGILADNPVLLQVLAEYKFAVAADEVAQESRQYRTDVPADADPFTALARQISDMEGCSVLYDPDKKRGDMLVDMVRRQEARGVVFLMTKFCDPEEFDFPMVKKALDNAGIPMVMIELDQQMRSFEQARTALQTFSEVLSA